MPDLIGKLSGDLLFSDENRFCLGVSDDRQLVRRRPGERLNSLDLLLESWEVFQQPYAHPHATTIKQYILQSVDMSLWPTQLADPSPIEYVWDINRRQLQHHQQPALIVSILTQQKQ
ncbi:uncharacterized protein TNCV_1821191 [Trichonephila clavipes]|nr:uncharacterized protein TNCV_1821191 [Trichonephila clavipes]